MTDLRELLEAGDEGELPASVKKAKALYRTCIDTGEFYHLYISTYLFTYPVCCML